MYKNLFRFLGAAALLSVGALIVLAILQWLDIPAGRFVDWVVGVLSFWWLTLIVTVPWNIHFDARRVLSDAAQSKKRNIELDPKRLAHVAQIARRALMAALTLHVVSAIALYWIAIAGVSPVGFVAAVVALLLTALRPGIRLYEYLAHQLRQIGREVRYPREDVVELLRRVSDLEDMLNLKKETSWAMVQVKAAQDNEAFSHQLKADTATSIQQLTTSLDQLRTENMVDHQRLGTEYRQALAQVTEDRRFLEHIREIIRFVKKA